MKCKKWAVPQWEQNTCWSRLRFTHFIIFNDIETWSKVDTWNNNILFIIRYAEDFFGNIWCTKHFLNSFYNAVYVFCAKSTLYGWNSEIIECIDCNHTVWRQPTKFWILLVIPKIRWDSHLHWKTGGKKRTFFSKGI